MPKKTPNEKPLANKRLGQHFLQDQRLAKRIVTSLTLAGGAQDTVVEIGPGTGALTQWLLSQYETERLWLVEKDPSLAARIRSTYPTLHNRVLNKDFLSINLAKQWPGPLAVIGNFPYNISSQILFHLLHFRQQVQQVVCMLQKEVADRIIAPPGSKTYGILSVLLQAFYHISYVEEIVTPDVFTPPPRVQSAIIRLKRNTIHQLACPEETFFKVVKMAFQQRRKMLHNALKPLLPPGPQPPWLTQRAEQLRVVDFVALAKHCQPI